MYKAPGLDHDGAAWFPYWGLHLLTKEAEHGGLGLVRQPPAITIAAYIQTYAYAMMAATTLHGNGATFKVLIFRALALLNTERTLANISKF